MAANKILLCSFVLIVLFQIGSCLDNGLARTPPMGWLSWLRYTCVTDCVKYPEDCIHEKLYREMADRLVSDGWKDLGYDYLCVDDCWSEMERDANNKLVPNKERFPSGIKALADYVHSKGLKFGLYGNMGHKTCAEYPGLVDDKDGTSYFDTDAKTLAEWGVDLFKTDGCFLEDRTTKFAKLFPAFGESLKKSGRNILYSCEWPLYVYEEGKFNQTPWEDIAKTCNIFRNYHDIESSWVSVTNVTKHYAENQDVFAKTQKPGAFFDPDMLALGNYGLSHDQEKAQMTFWAIFSAPLIMSLDLRKMSTETRRILQNKHIIDVNQDALGKFGKRVIQRDEKYDRKLEVWAKPLTGDSYAVAYVQLAALGAPKYFEANVTDILHPLEPLHMARKYKVLDLFDDLNEVTVVNTNDVLELKVPPTGVNFVKLVPV